MAPPPPPFNSFKLWLCQKSSILSSSCTISAHADGGPRSRVCARRERKLSGACVCRVTFKHLPQPFRSHIRFGTIGQLLKIPTLSAQKCHSAGGRRGPWILYGVGILVFLWVRSPCKISEPYDNFWKYPPCPPKNVIVRGVGGVH
jgi:hypothetical protein